MSDLMNGLAELDNARGDYKQAEQYYTGDVPEFFASARLRRALAATGMTFRFNFAKTPVDVVADRLEIAAIVGADDEQTKLLQQVWSDNQMDLYAPHLHVETGEYGDAYVIVWPRYGDTSDDPDNPDSGPRVEGVDIHVNSPLTTRVIYSEENVRVKAYAIKTWQDRNRRRANLYYPDRIEKYATKDGSDGDEESEWFRFVEGDRDGDGELLLPADAENDDRWPMPNRYGQIPVFHFRTGLPYGQPDHKGAYGPQDVINKLLITFMASVDFLGFPQRWRLLEADIGSDDAADWDDDDAEADEDTGNASTLRADPGTMWDLRGTKEVGQFAAADPAVFINPTEFAVRAMAQITTTPQHYFDPSGDQPSGESLRAADAPLVKRIDYRKLLYGAAHADYLELALRMLGVADPAVQVKWASTQSVDDFEGWQAVAAKIEAGVPVFVALSEAGYTDTEMASWGPGVGLRERVDLLVGMSEALQGLSAAATLGAVSEQQVQAIIAAFTEDILGDREADGATA